MAEATSVAKIDNSGILSLVDIQRMIGSMLPQTTDKSSTISPSPAALAASNSVLGLVTPGITDQADALVQNILQRSAQEFLPYAREEKVAGLYNTSTINQMRGEARARATGESARAVKEFQAQSGRTAADITNEQLRSSRTQTERTTVQPQVSGSMLSTLIGGGTLLNKLIGADKKKKGGIPTGGLLPDSAAERAAQASADIADAEAGFAATAQSESINAAANIGGGEVASVSNSLGLDSNFADGISQGLTSDASGLGVNLRSGYDASTFIGGADILGPEDALDNFDLLGDVGGNFGGQALVDFGGDTVLDFAGEASLDAAASIGFPYLSAARLAGQVFDIDEINEPLNLVSEAVGGIADAVGDGISDLVGKVICTEACRQGLMTVSLYHREALANLSRLHPTTLRGYHKLAIPFVDRMRKNKQFAVWMAGWAVDYSHYILLESFSTKGWLLSKIGEPICFVVGFFCSDQKANVKALYANSNS